MAEPRPIVEDCKLCGDERRWHYAHSHRPDNEAQPERVSHFFLCFCGITAVLDVFADGRQERRRPPSGRWEVAL